MAEEDMFEAQNQNELRQHLENLEQEFQVTYSQRKQAEYNDPKEELERVIQELNEREQACKAVAGIALFLMDEKDALIEKFNEMQNMKEKLEVEVQEVQAQLEERLNIVDQLEQKINYKKRKRENLKNELEDREMKIKQYEDCIEELKQEHENLYAQYVQIESEKEQKKRQPRASFLLVQQTKLNFEKKDLEDQISNLQREVQQLEKNLQECRKQEAQ